MKNRRTAVLMSAVASAGISGFLIFVGMTMYFSIFPALEEVPVMAQYAAAIFFWVAMTLFLTPFLTAKWYEGKGEFKWDMWFAVSGFCVMVASAIIMFVR